MVIFYSYVKEPEGTQLRVFLEMGDPQVAMAFNTKMI